ncbi:tRNA 2-thiouridine(34) synthase MnmA [Candidatus Falkowbacteria bacterium]|jgi:tRNA-uridine 2-sulfurtransferase|nr:tRNA 2-thiouridine(34) synthase MnmA [Candidatus Falkowbacteria bacterium]MBT7007364.1 tRNA 2-thiouridine(34) synthase MnmA [Candidatus Falkowbacteria bacterium]
MNKNNKIKVAIGMSGGVDSSVAAALLKKQGYDVVGIFIQFWSEKVKGSARDNVCCSFESKNDAQKVCRQLGMPFYTMNMKTDFKKAVVDDFICKYEKGDTPNPCVRCNKYIKFGEFIKRAKALGCDYVATGHYSRITHHVARNKYELKKSKDKEKDQTYFLHQLTQNQLKHVLFPVGKYTKPEVRKLAKKFDLPTKSKLESQEVCFIPDGNLEKFLKRHLTFSAGDIKDIKTKEVLGQHKGLPVYTIGQRKGIGLAAGPWFVVRKDSKSNVLWVTNDEKDLLSNEFTVKNVNWIVGTENLLFPMRLKCKIRYRTKSVFATIKKDSKSKSMNNYIVQFKKPQRAITKGQYAVFYKGKSCLGGGEIY